MDITIVVLLIILLLTIVAFVTHPESFSNMQHTFKTPHIFKTPPSYTKLLVKEAETKKYELSQISNANAGKTLLEMSKTQLEKVIKDNRNTIDSVNIIQLPTFFNANEKWPGCLPRPLYQGSCGSCWGFASVTCLSSRFFIESCGNSTCGNYPQINNGSIDDVYANINEMYNFNKIYLKSITEYITVGDEQNMSQTEWMGAIMKLQKKMWELPVTSQDRYFISQILVNILDFQSMGSLNLKDMASVRTRAQQTFVIWRDILNEKYDSKSTTIDISQLLSYWRKQPLGLSAEKLITCCINCYILEFEASPTQTINNPACMGGSLVDAWTLLRDIGTTETLCIGYNLDTYQENEELPSCRELQGPFYSFCTGYSTRSEKMSDTILNKELNRIENSGAYPAAVPYESKYPWVDPQLLRFKAKNAYTIANNVKEIQREIIERGPVNSGFYVYDDFETQFGGMGLGGQMYDGTNALGGGSNSLIYMRDPRIKTKPTGGHAITIVGWGVFNYKGTDIPYWTVLNSWGVGWGHSGFPGYQNRSGVPKNLKGGGYFWIVRGVNNCGIESNVVCGQPNIENLSYPGVISRYGWGAEPPDTVNKAITFLPPLNTKQLDVNGKKLEILPTIIGGGGFVDFAPPSVYEVKSMKSPSPFIMFWQEDRPVYCIGAIQNSISGFDQFVKISDNTEEFLKLIRSQIYKNPLILIGDGTGQEQVQLLAMGEGQIKIGRGVNFNMPKSHNAGSSIKVFPYQDLSIDFLEGNRFKKCGTPSLSLSPSLSSK